ncbi:MAG: endonuclease [Bacteroidales bacterium]|nr:endonuclease [Bacteroidales bacterium]
MSEEISGREVYKVVFWNLENYFDPFDDPATSDDEFTPTGEKRWSWKKFVKKRNDIAKVIISLAGENYPALIGFAEVENRFVIEQLVRSSPLAMLDYSVIHRDSPDERGIDVALLYKQSLFRPLKSAFYCVSNRDSSLKTRLILYAKGVLEDLDTIHVFVNHWPSKLGGESVSGPKRESAARTLRRVCDSILAVNSRANIIIMGDFNDTPESQLFRSTVINSPGNRPLVNLAALLDRKGVGTIKYKSEWELIDMFIISLNLLDEKEPLFCPDGAMRIYKPQFLLEEDRIYLGKKPFRCLTGPRYNGGISDHLPIVLSINKMWQNPVKK